MRMRRQAARLIHSGEHEFATRLGPLRGAPGAGKLIHIALGVEALPDVLPGGVFGCVFLDEAQIVADQGS